MDEFFNIIQRIGIFIVLSQTLLHFRPSEEYEKYIKVLSNIMILAMFVIPIMGIFQKGIGEEFVKQTELYEEQMKQVEIPVEKLNLSMDKSIEEEIKTRLNKITPKGYEIKEVMVDEENSSILIVMKELGQGTECIQVEKVKLEEEKENENEDEETSSGMQGFKEKCAEILGIGEAYVEVVVRG